MNISLLLKSFLIFILLLSANQLLAEENWKVAPSLNAPRSGASAVVLNDKIYVIGGRTTENKVLNTVETFDSATNRWDDSSTARLLLPRHSATAIVFKDSIYVMGGIAENGRVLDEVEIYDPITNTWTGGERLLSKRQGHFSVILNNRVCVMGGKDENDEFIATIEWFKEDESRWIAANTGLHAQRIWPFFAETDNITYIFGGFNPFPVSANVQGEITPDWFFTWVPLEPLQQGRGYGAATILNNKIFLMGGEILAGSDRDTTNIVETYDLVRKVVEPAASLPTQRLGMSAVTLGETIYLIGGYGAGNTEPIALVEAYTEVVAIADENPATIPLQFANIAGYPNPFNGSINLEVAIPNRGMNEISIYNIQGQKIKTLYNGILHPGEHTFQWNGNDQFNTPVASGLYFALLKANSYIEKFKIVYLK